MDPAKRAVILKEIEYWRSSKLLPDQYCDFLRNLYIEHEAGPTDKEIRRGGGRLRLSLQGLLYSFGVLGFILLFILYFTSFLPVMQTVLSVLLIGLLIAIGLIKRKQQPIVAFVALGAGCMLTLLLGWMFLVTFHFDGPGATVALIAFCGTVWIATGLASRIGILQLSGYFALLLAYLWLIQDIHPEPSWLILQLYTLPCSLALYSFGNMAYRGFGSPGSMLMIASGLFLLLPEVYGLILTDISGFILQLALALKMALGGVAVWTRWKKNKSNPEWISEQE